LPGSFELVPKTFSNDKNLVNRNDDRRVMNFILSTKHQKPKEKCGQHFLTLPSHLENSINPA